MVCASDTTIVALSSGSLPSGVAVIRLSGPHAFAIGRAVSGALPTARALSLRALRDPVSREILDHGMVAVFPAPNSFTGEDCVELHAHGSPATVKALLRAMTRTGACALAGAGDFTRRAFENGKLDLTTIEGLGDLLDAETETQRRQALSRFDGRLSAKTARWRDRLLALRAEIEANLDFSDEDDVPDTLSKSFWDQVQILDGAIEATLKDFARGRVEREGFRVVLFGAPNAGKSSLLNALAGSEVAIVTDEAGTTRDTKDVTLDLAGTRVILTDTAGLRDTASKAEAAGIALTRQALERADLGLWLLAPDAPEERAPDVTNVPLWRVATKTDLSAPAIPFDHAISTTTGSGLDGLLYSLRAQVENYIGDSEPALISHLRDVEALTLCTDALKASQGVEKPLELVAEDLRRASGALERLIGLVDSEQVLDRLFAGFCIGK